MSARFVGALLLLAAHAVASECRLPTVCELMARGLKAAFVGEVVEGAGTAFDDPVKTPAHMVRVRVAEALAGIPPGLTHFTFPAPAYNEFGCGTRLYLPGKRYLFISPAPYIPPRFEFGSLRLDDLEDFDLPLLRGYFAGRLVTQVRGRIVVTRHGGWAVKVLLMTNEAKPIGGTVVSAISTDGRRFSARTDTEGRYVLPLPWGGGYRMKAARPPYTAEHEGYELVPESGCALRDFTLQSRNQLSGVVRDVAGRPQPGILVRLIDLDRSWRALTYTTQKDSSFQFRDVPLGRYLLAVDNRDDSWSREPLQRFFANTFYPGLATRESAKVIEIASNGVNLRNLDITLGAPVPLRTVRVRVAARRAGGDALRHWGVTVDAEPRNADDLPWSTQSGQYNEQSGWHEFKVPANRRLRIEAKDWYGRTAPGQYVSLHEPSADPIIWEVAVSNAKRSPERPRGVVGFGAVVIDENRVVAAVAK